MQFTSGPDKERVGPFVFIGLDQIENTNWQIALIFRFRKETGTGGSECLVEKQSEFILVSSEDDYFQSLKDLMLRLELWRFD